MTRTVIRKYYIYRGGEYDPDHKWCSEDGYEPPPKDVTNVGVAMGIKAIGKRVFNNCYSLSSAALPFTLTTIGEGAFDSCGSLSSITLPPSLRIIGKDAFYECRSLSSITLPPTLTTIGEGAFESCQSLTTITIPESVYAISSAAFFGLLGPEKLTIDGLLPTTSFDKWDTYKLKDSLLVAGFTSIDPYNLLKGQIRDTYYDLEYDSRIMYYSLKRWARARGGKDVDGRLLLHIAAARSLKWKITEQFFETHRPAIFEMDKLTGLSPFMLAATGPNSDLETIFNLLNKNPAAIISQQIYTEKKSVDKKGLKRKGYL